MCKNIPGCNCGGNAPISGGTSGQIPYQLAPNITRFVSGTSGQLLKSNGTAAPSFINPTSITAGSASNIAGGSANQIVYQTATNTTGFVSVLPVNNGGTGRTSIKAPKFFTNHTAGSATFTYDPECRWSEIWLTGGGGGGGGGVALVGGGGGGGGGGTIQIITGNLSGFDYTVGAGGGGGYGGIFTTDYNGHDGLNTVITSGILNGSAAECGYGGFGANGLNTSGGSGGANISTNYKQLFRGGQGFFGEQPEQPHTGGVRGGYGGSTYYAGSSNANTGFGRGGGGGDNGSDGNAGADGQITVIQYYQ